MRVPHQNGNRQSGRLHRSQHGFTVSPSENKLNGRSQRLVAYRRNRRVVRIWRPATARQPPVESAAPSTPLASGRHVTARPPSCSRATVGPPAVVPRVPVSASAAETTSRRSPPAKPLTPAAQGSQPGPRALVRRGPLVHLSGPVAPARGAGALGGGGGRGGGSRGERLRVERGEEMFRGIRIPGRREWRRRGAWAGGTPAPRRLGGRGGHTERERPRRVGKGRRRWWRASCGIGGAGPTAPSPRGARRRGRDAGRRCGTRPVGRAVARAGGRARRPAAAGFASRRR